MRRARLAPAAHGLHMSRRRSRGAGSGRLAVAPAGACLALLVLAGPAAADHQGGHTAPQGPAKVRFADDFPELLDSEWGFAIGGFGGLERGAPRNHAPVIFVHGNNVDHADWYPVRDDFLAAGWTDQELWALSYNGLGGNNGTALQRSNPERDAEHQELGWDGQSRVTANDVNVPDLVAFVEAVREYTGSERYHLVGHSLGVTVARKALLTHPDLQRGLVSFVGIAGANHGTSFCPPGTEGELHSCDEIAAGTPWLEELNGPNGELESYGTTRWLTIYDGTGVGDPAFAGEPYAQSPRLEGAENVEYPGVYHNDLRIREDIVAFYREWIEEADAAASAPTPEAASTPESTPVPEAAPVPEATPASGSIPATGIPAALLALVGSASTAVGVVTLARRRR